jgi:diguanylate cyclase (GGDEF)-like protein
MRKFSSRLSLLAKFASVSLLAIAALGLVVGRSFQMTIQEQGRDRAIDAAALIARADIAPRIPSTDLHNEFSDELMRTTDQRLADHLGDDQIETVTVWNKDLEVIYSSDHKLIGHTASTSPELDLALDGKEAATVSSGGTTGKEANGENLIRAFIPLDEDSTSGAVLEVNFSFRPVAASIAGDQKMLFIILFGGLALIYAIMFFTVARASRTLRKQAKETKHQALHDALTGLHNRSYFRERVEQAVVHGKAGGERTCLMLIDLDRFKEVNDTLGHHNGDQLLRQIGNRLKQELRESDTVARLGGDEFAVLLRDVTDTTQIVRTAERILTCLKQPLFFMGLTLDVGASIGISLFPDHARDVDSLLQRADVAMYVAKETHSGYEFYTADRDQNSLRRLALGSELSKAIQNKEVILYYQPKADMRTGRIIGVEALARWQHNYRGIVPPDEFIPLAEQTQLIRPLTINLLDEALRQSAVWSKKGINLKIAVNLSSRNLLDLTLPEEVARLLQKWQVEPALLELEITESTIMADARRALTVLSTLNSMGVGLAIDDFGTGFSSLSYLKRLPVKEIKMDKSFVMKMAMDENDAAIVRSTIDLSHNLGLRVVAEGVETEAIWNQLTALGCDLAQGYYLNRPVPPEDLEAWLRDWNGRMTPGAPAIDSEDWERSLLG